MGEFAFFVGGVLPYATAVAFVVGMAYRFYVWCTTPQPDKITLYPWPDGSMFRDLLGKVLFFPGLFKSDKILWAMSWVFHVSLGLVLVGHFRFFSTLIDRGLMALGVSAAGIEQMSSLLGGAAGITILATAASLIIRRQTVQRVREISTLPDHFALLLLVAIIATGDAMRFSSQHFDLTQTRVWAWSLLTFNPVVPQNSAFLVHATLAQLLLMLIPFSKILHWGGIFFTQALMHTR